MAEVITAQDSDQMDFGLIESPAKGASKDTTNKSEIPVNHKWFRGEIHTSAWGADRSPVLGTPRGRVMVTMLGKKMEPSTNNGIASVFGRITRVSESEDKEWLGQSGWWRVSDLSAETTKAKRKKI